MIKSKFSFGQFYLGIGLIVVVGLSFFIMFTFTPGIFVQAKNNSPRIFGSIFTAIFTLYFIIAAEKAFRWITITPEGLTIRRVWNKETILWSDVSKIEVLGSGQIALFSSRRKTDASTIETKGGRTITIFAPFYRNMRDMRLVLSRAAQLMQEGKNVSAYLDMNLPEKTRTEDIGISEEAEKFSNNLFLSQNGIALLVLAGVFVFTWVNPTMRTDFAGIGFLFFIALFYVVFGRFSYYFLISPRHLIIKNHLFPWYRKVYALDDITDARLEQRYRSPISLSITTKDFQTGVYPANTLWTKTWRKLMDRLQREKIPVRNDAFV